MASTRRLWIGQTDFPQVPLFGWACGIPGWADWLPLTAMLTGLALTLSGRTRRTGWLLFAVSWAASAVLDQHRVQVWAWHIALCGLLIALSDHARALTRLRWLTVVIYLWSAWSRVDVTFFSGVGSHLAQGLAASVGMRPLEPSTARFVAMCFPFGEALTALMLALPRRRRIGMVLSLAMHGGLLLALGPWGLGHEPGVLLWNLLFVVQNPLLFWPVDSEAGQHGGPKGAPAPRSPGHGNRFVAPAVLLVASVMPAVRPFGLWDVWPSWAVYSNRGGWTVVLVHVDDIAQLPVDCKDFVRDPLPLSDWCAMDLDAWSRETLRCPLNPDSRFRSAIALHFARRARIQVDVAGPPNRWTGEAVTETFELSTPEKPQALRKRHWLNVRVRDFRGPDRRLSDE